MIKDQWYVVAAQPGRETIAELHLKMQDFAVWMPRQLRVVRHARRRYEKRVPFFPGYLFVLLDIGRDRWRSINATAGVRSLVMRAERPAPCPSGLVEGLQALTGEDGMFDAMAMAAPGDKVRVVSGPFAELRGTLVSLDGRRRARILLGLMQGMVAVTLNPADLVPAAA